MVSVRSATRTGPLRPVAETLVVMTVVSAAFWLVGLLARPLAAYLFVLSPPTVVHPWTLVTSVYAHAGVGHLLSNAVVVVVAGVPVAASTTRARFHGFVLATGALAGLAQVWLGGLLVPTGVVGISGAAFALVGYVAAANPAADALGRAARRLDVSPRLLVVAVGVLALAVTVVFSPAGSALISHFVGLLLGVGAGRARLLRV
ncbi:rhomboid family intramembrane serine protease [Halobaculum magnesiiphilum]|uniref:Rhomboid family intramembrane serine protease n=1 Tax=Halobaculum magnesiiphilum TaxID=1017351 RepID=A0A8T8WB54_9EURY|nr:rhomboid family intramembrane serine protease [Halobaculum magnesiiphilum]QZP37102.1 rhomboid family intramembrane serine protease [Halobaculum magnesiiphilum]